MANSPGLTIAIGCDPSSGVSSPLGLSGFVVETKQILFLDEYWPTSEHKPKLEHRIRDLSEALEERLMDPVFDEAERVLFFVESFVMAGKNGETLQRMIGSVYGRLPYRFELREVHNTKVKLLLAGHGHADKEQVAQGVREFFNNDDQVLALLKDGKWDILDSLGIAIAGLLIDGNKEQQQKGRQKAKRGWRPKAAPKAKVHKASRARRRKKD